MQDVVSDGNYYFDADGNVTTDEAKAVRWLARTGANVLPQFKDALKAFQEAGDSKVAQPEEVDDEPKSKAPKANKKAKPSENKGVKK